MQTEGTALPVVQLNKNINRKQNPDLQSATVETTATISGRNIACLSSNKRCLYPLRGAPYKRNIPPQPLADNTKLKKTNIGQRVLSAKMLRLKELQNQLADAHYHLNELANENRLLKALQKRQDSALKRYEGANAELPRIIHSHHEELRILQAKYKKLKAQHKETCELLKEKESEIQCLQSQNNHLLQLSKDRNLEEREKLQLQVSDLNHRIEQQQETIQTLHRKLTLESKSLKHQLRIELSKRKETQKNLEEAIEKLQCLESLLDNRERRLYYNGQLQIHNRESRLGTQSFTNLRDISISNSLKLSDKDKKEQKDNLPSLNTPESNDDENVNNMNGIKNPNQTSVLSQTETMASLNQIRNYRLQKPSRIFQSGRHRDFSITEVEDTLDQQEIKADEFKRIYENKKYNCVNETLKELKACDYSSEDMESGNEMNYGTDYCTYAAKKSRELHTRLIDNEDDTSDAVEKILNKTGSNYEKEESPTSIHTEEINVPHSKYKRTLKIPERYKRTDFYESDSDLESELGRELSQVHLSSMRKNGIFNTISTKNERKHFNDQTSTDQYNKTPNSNGHQMLDESGNHLENLLDTVETQVNRDNIGHKYHTKYSADREIKDSEYNSQDNKYSNNSCITKSKDMQRQDLNNRTIDQTVLDEHNTNTILASEKLNHEPEEPKVAVERNEFPENDFVSYIEKAKNVASKSQNLDVRTSTTLHEDEQEMVCSNVGPKDVLNKEGTKDVDKSQNNRRHVTNELQETHTVNTDIIGTHNGNNNPKIITYDKEKLLASMKAIDDNENVEFVSREFGTNNGASRKQITENLFRGLPTQTKRKQDIIRNIFETDTMENKPRSSCSKLH